MQASLNQTVNGLPSGCGKSKKAAPYAAKPKRGTVQAEVVNNTPYGGYVNDGHRTVNKKGETTGWVEGQFFLDKGVEAATAALPGLFEQALGEVKDKYGL